MNPLTFFYTELIYRPLLNSLVFIYAILPYQDLGLAIAVMTVAVRILLHPFIHQTIRSQQAMARLQPQLAELQDRFKDKKEEQARRTMELYRKEGVHPLSGCLPILIQMPILIGLYQVFWKGIVSLDSTLLYSFLPAIGAFDSLAFGLFDLSHPSAILALAAGASQFMQGKFLSPAPAVSKGKSATSDFSRAMQWQITYFFPLIIAGISWSLPSALAFYWTIFNLFAIVQQQWIQRRLKKI